MRALLLKLFRSVWIAMKADIDARLLSEDDIYWRSIK